MPKLLRIFFIAVGFLLLFIGLGLGGLALAYQHRFYPGVQVAGIHVAGQSQEQGTKAIQTLISQYGEHPVTLVVADATQPINPVTNAYPDVQIKSRASDLGVIFNDRQVSDQAWGVGHSRNITQWLRSVVGALVNGTIIPVAYTVDQKQTAQVVQLDIVPHISPPVPAKIVVQGDQVVVTPAKRGTEIDQKSVISQVVDSLATTKDSDPTFVRIPTEVADSPVTAISLQSVADQWTAMSNLKLSLSINGATLKPSKTQLLQWFLPVQDQQGKVALSVQAPAISAYLLSQSKVVDAAASTIAITNTLLPYLDNKASKQQIALTLALKPGTQKNTQPGTYTLGKYDGKYIEVNLAEQKLYRINGNTLEKVYLVSSGKASTPTPKGTFAIHGKAVRPLSSLYGLYMPWWQNFLNGEYGLHELPEWPNGYKEGVGHLGIPVSDGCVRLGVGDAKELYDWTEIGTPVVIF